MIKLENVSKTIKGNTVLEDINITLHKGKVYGLKGINGSGKTMLMRIISGLIYPTKGSVFINGKRLGDKQSFPEKLGLLLENPVFLISYTGLDNLRLLASLNGRIGAAEIRESLEKVGLAPDDKRKYRKYSLGMKQRLGIAAAIMEKPEILILDEPISALDTEGISLFTEIMRAEKEKGTLVILSCHDEYKLREYTDIILTIENGKIVDMQESEDIEKEGL